MPPAAVKSSASREENGKKSGKKRGRSSFRIRAASPFSSHKNRPPALGICASYRQNRGSGRTIISRNRLHCHAATALRTAATGRGGSPQTAIAPRRRRRVCSRSNADYANSDSLGSCRRVLRHFPGPSPPSNRSCRSNINRKGKAMRGVGGLYYLAAGFCSVACFASSVAIRSRSCANSVQVSSSCRRSVLISFVLVTISASCFTAYVLMPAI